MATNSFRFRVGDPVPHRADWQFETPLGIGGFGEVWRIRQTHFDRVEAIKFCLNEHAKRVLANEGVTLAALHRKLPAHPNIVAVTAINLRVEPFWIAFEFVAGTRLDILIAERGRMRWQDVTSLFAEIVRGVAAAHKGDIVHRDIKPANIIVNESNVPKILDFGLGRLLVEDAIANELAGDVGDIDISGA